MLRVSAALLAGALVIAGVALVFVPAAFIVGGVLLGAWALLFDDGTPG